MWDVVDLLTRQTDTIDRNAVRRNFTQACQDRDIPADPQAFYTKDITDWLRQGWPEAAATLTAPPTFDSMRADFYKVLDDLFPGINPVS
jgi:hypothetical protein